MWAKSTSYPHPQSPAHPPAQPPAHPTSMSKWPWSDEHISFARKSPRVVGLTPSRPAAGKRRGQTLAAPEQRRHCFGTLQARLRSEQTVAQDASRSPFSTHAGGKRLLTVAWVESAAKDATRYGRMMSSGLENGGGYEWSSKFQAAEWIVIGRSRNVDTCLPPLSKHRATVLKAFLVLHCGAAHCTSQ